MASEVIALASTLFTIGLQLNNAIEQIKYNRESHRVLVHRITSSLTHLKAESKKLSRASPSLIRSVKRLKQDLEHILERCRKAGHRSNTVSSRIKEFFDKDAIDAALRGIEKQISDCLLEFGTLSAIRVERKLGEHNVQVNRKLDELLRRTPARAPRSSIDSTHSVRAPPGLSREVKTASSRSSTDIHEPSKVANHKIFVPLPHSISSDTNTSTSTAASTVTTFEQGKIPPPPSLVRSDPSVDSTVRIAKRFRSSESSYASQANDLDSECRRLRAMKHPSEALVPGRRAVTLRRLTYSSDQNVKNAAALARSLTYVSRCLKDIQVDSQYTGTRVTRELTSVLSECVDLYKKAFREDRACRVDLATALYNLSVRQSEPSASPKSMSSPTLGLNMSALYLKTHTDLSAALDSADEAVHHFSVLEREDPDSYAMDLANALLNLSFILSDLGRNEKALVIARKAVILAYRLTSTDPQSQERVRSIRTLHKALMRVSYCLDSLGRKGEAEEAEMEAKDVLKRQFLVLGS